MSWGPYDDPAPRPYHPIYGARYPPQFDTMSFHNQNYNSNQNQPYPNMYPSNYHHNYADYSAYSPGPSQNHYEPEAVHQEVGGAKRRPNQKWGQKNERYGSGRTSTSNTNRGNEGNGRNHHKNRSEAEAVENSEVVEENGEGGTRNNNFRSKQNFRNGTGDGQRKPYYNKGGYDEGRRNNYYGNGHNSNKQRDGNQGYGRGPQNQKYRPQNGPYDGNRSDHYQARSNWRRFENNMPKKCHNSAEKDQKKLDAASQRERLEQMLARRTLECIVCYEKIKHTDKTWSCALCYHILHLTCTIEWANSSKSELTWRCPACQNPSDTIPKQYTCYCSKTIEPRPLPGVVPHACGHQCLKKGRNCHHKCAILCHPGPCPDCSILIEKPCGCGAIRQTVKCSSEIDVVCEGVCGRQLECGVHTCAENCHSGECKACEKLLQQSCYCGKQAREVVCSEEFKGAVDYVCGSVCEKELSCGNHKCELECHSGACQPCDRDIGRITTCPCGRSGLKAERKSCLDAIPVCEGVCDKVLACGPSSDPHRCKIQCHEGECPQCSLTTKVRCRCGHMNKEMECVEVKTKADDARCEVKCTKKRLCGKHRCNQRCCIEIEHICTLPCNHLLACGHHRCERTCHSGRCPPCIETSFEELYCECGANVLYPPIPCGRKPPPCDRPCSRARPCGHEVNHTCHTGACPPCTVLCKRFCYGKHEQRSAIPCYQDDFSCGLPCGKPMPCGVHKCDKACHQGNCPLPCKQKCLIKRSSCGHDCGHPCHRGTCPKSSCRQNVPITCPCGLQKAFRPCVDLADAYKEIEMAQLNEKMADFGKEQSVDISDIVRVKKPAILKILECTEECKVFERNRRLAIGLQIRNPDLSQKLTPRYSEFMRGWAKKDPQFCAKIHDKLAELVQLAKQSKQKSRAHSFESMNRDKRHLVHEYCEHFGVESAAYDDEPNRNIVATAIKDKSWLPSMSLLEVIQRENGQRKVPRPVLGTSKLAKSESVALKLPGRGQKVECVDYFSNPPL